MKTFLNPILFAALLSATACGSSNQENELASDTASVFDTTRLDTRYDTSAVYDVKANGPVQAAAPTQYEESNGKQSTRTSIGGDTTGMQPHDNLPNRTGVNGAKGEGSAVGGSNQHPLGRERD